MKVDDLGHGPYIHRLGGPDLPALADQHDPELGGLAHAAPHHVDIPGFENSQRQRPVREQHNIERKKRN